MFCGRRDATRRATCARRVVHTGAPLEIRVAAEDHVRIVELEQLTATLGVGEGSRRGGGGRCRRRCLRWGGRSACTKNVKDLVDFEAQFVASERRESSISFQNYYVLQKAILSGTENEQTKMLSVSRCRRRCAKLSNACK